MAFQIKNLFSRLYKLTFDVFFYSSALACLLALLPEHLYNDFPFNPTSFPNDHLHLGLRGLKWNNDLVTKAKRVGAGTLYGPESLAEAGEHIYTGLADGRIVRIHKGNHKVEDVVRIIDAKQCGKPAKVI